MTTEIEIVNRALGRIGEALLTSLSDSNERARLARLELVTSKQYILRRANWNFATRWVELAVECDNCDKNPSFDYTYQVPNDCVLVQAVKHPSRDATVTTVYDTGLRNVDRYEVNGIYVSCNINPALIRYTKDVDLGQWSIDATEALSWHLAASLCNAFSRSAETRQFCELKYQEAYNVAQNTDAKEGTHDRFQTDNRLTGTRVAGHRVGW